ncbi:hypothetical protein [Rathayibacter sp. AY1A7]|uniref:hypothetical protein n=1 Tax=Rathayibacter sp. AY1A7 TaxID=2080524 RepID=UPI0011B0CF12|nr:hypothetical protein [Rathayibacter sp. AY1A7]
MVEDFEDDAREFGLDDKNSLRPGYLGYTIQQYVSKSVRDGSRRGVRSYDYYRKQIPARARKLAETLRPLSLGESRDLGTVPHMFSMVPLAQSRHAPISSLTSADGLRGSQISQQAKYREQLDDIGAKLAEDLQTANATAMQ